MQNINDQYFLISISFIDKLIYQTANDNDPNTILLDESA